MIDLRNILNTVFGELYSEYFLNNFSFKEYGILNTFYKYLEYVL